MLSFFQQLYLFWRDSDPINVKYVFFSTTTSTAIIHVCGRTGKELIFNIAGHVPIRFKSFQFIRVTVFCRTIQEKVTQFIFGGWVDLAYYMTENCFPQHRFCS